MNDSKKKLREFGFIFSIIFPFLFGWLIPLLNSHGFRVWTLFLSFPVLLLSFFIPKKLLYFYKIWMKLGYLLGWINSRVILGLIFILVLQPIALMMKCLGYNPLRKKILNQNSFKEYRKEIKVDLKKIF